MQYFHIFHFKMYAFLEIVEKMILVDGWTIARCYANIRKMFCIISCTRLIIKASTQNSCQVMHAEQEILLFS